MITHTYLGTIYTHRSQGYLGKTNTQKGYKIYPMSEQSDRLRRARLEAGYKRQADAIRAFGWNRNTYKSNENGNATFSYELAETYATAYRVSTEWLFRGAGPVKPVRTALAPPPEIPIVGKAAAGPEGHFLDPYPVGGHPTLDPFPEGSIAVQVDGDSMEPRFFSGERIVFGPIANDSTRHLNEEALVHLEDGRTLIKILDVNRATGGWSLRSYNPRHAPIEDVTVAWSRPFLGMQTNRSR